MEEEICLASGSFTVTLAPWLGGKITSIALAGRELLQNPLLAYAARTQTMAFEESDASGWDECLPSVSACQVQTSKGSVSIPDHGDLWRVPWERISSSANSAGLRAECFSLPLVLERKVTLNKVEKTFRLELAYKLTNNAHLATPWSWSAHPLFALEAGDRILLPRAIKQLRLEASTGERLGSPDATIAWPFASLHNGDTTDLSIVQPSQSGIGDKLFAGPLGSAQSWCALHRPSAGIRIRIGFDPIALPYLGIWLCYGGWPARPGLKQMCVALEPATAPVDSLARTGPWSRTLAPHESFSWKMHADFEQLA